MGTVTSTSKSGAPELNAYTRTYAWCFGRSASDNSPPCASTLRICSVLHTLAPALRCTAALMSETATWSWRWRMSSLCSWRSRSSRKREAASAAGGRPGAAAGSDVGLPPLASSRPSVGFPAGVSASSSSPWFPRVNGPGGHSTKVSALASYRDYAPPRDYYAMCDRVADIFSSGAVDFDPAVCRRGSRSGTRVYPPVVGPVLVFVV